MTPRPIQYLWLAVGFGIWALALSLIYGLHALGCAYGWSSEAIRIMIGGILISHLALLAVLIVIWRRREGFLRTVTLWSLCAAFVATAFSYGPILFLSTCIP